MDEILKLPKLALNMTEGTVTRWLKQEGDLVTKGEPLVEVSTGKVNVQVDAPVSGKLVRIMAPAGSKMPVDSELAQIKPLEVTGTSGTPATPGFDPALAEKPFDVVVIGGGPGGYVAAIRAAQLGGRVALVEKDQLGGTCLNRGCIPTKALARSAELFADFRRAGEFGLTATAPRADLAKIMARKDTVVEQLRTGIAQLLRSNRITVLSGTGAIAGPGRVQVGNEAGSITLQTANIILATGSRPTRVPIPGIESPGVLTSDDILSLTELPKSLIILGGGVIGVEMAWIFSTLGAKVTIIELLPRILANVDEEIAAQLQDILISSGIAIYTGTGVNRISPVEGGGLAVNATDQDGAEKVFYGEKMLVSAGREYNTQNLNLEKHGITMDKRAIQVDARLRTTVPGIYAVGDVTGKILLAHVASAQGIVAAENAMGLKREMDYSAVPGAIFTSPEVGSVGLSESQASALAGQQGLAIKVSRFPFAAIGKALAMGETRGQVKIICEEKTGKILGAHILGPHATDLIAVLTVAMQNGLTADQIAHTIFAHPTTAEIIMEAAHGISGKAIHFSDQ